MIAHRFVFRLPALLALYLLALAVPANVAAGVCIAGDAHGSWDGPVEIGDTGSASGVLVADGTEEPLFDLDATLTGTDSIGLDYINGDVFGVLTDPSDPTGTPAYGIAGNWVINTRLPESPGGWQASSYDLDSGDAVGEMSGTFTIPPSGGEGEFVARWYIGECP
jgi:hypothetical protein